MLSSRALRAEIAITGDFDVGWVNEGAMELSHDGSRLAYRGRGGIKIRDLATGSTRLLADTEKAIFPFWSPHGFWVAFFADGKLRKVPATGGPVQIISDAPDGRGGAWSRDGTIAFAPNVRGALMRVSSSGGTPAPITSLTGRDSSHRNPRFLPDERHFLFSAVDAGGKLHAAPSPGWETLGVRAIGCDRSLM